MIKHIVMWRLKNKADAFMVKRELDALKTKVPQIKNIEAGVNFNTSDAAYDLVLYSEFETRAQLDAYQIHSDHKVVVALMKDLVKEKAVVDYES